MRRTSKAAAIMILSGVSLAAPVFAQWDYQQQPPIAESISSGTVV